jgi:hypothetical protein
MLNLAASDRRAWYEYIKLKNKPIESLTYDIWLYNVLSG